jgi:hypothetical protein
MQDAGGGEGGRGDKGVKGARGARCKIEVARCRGQFAHALENKRNFIIVDSERSESWN